MTDEIDIPDEDETAEVCFYCEADLDEDDFLMCDECGAEFCSVRCIELHESEGCE
jgi:hypothetical protein